MHIEEYISELLFEHNCVIVPEFGGFIGNYSPSRIDPVKHLFEPPHKRILFNKGLVQNDGLLANHIATRENISYSQAVNEIAKSVKHYQTEIKGNKRISLDNIGVLYTDEQGNLLFRQDEKVNYLPEAFGLTAFYELPVNQDTKDKEEGKVVELHPYRKYIKPVAVAASVAALFTSAFWLSLNQTRLGLDYSSLNPFSKKEAKAYTFTERQPLPAISYAKDSAEMMKLFTPKESVTPDNTATTTGNYQIIAGCFRLSENANNLIKRMKQHNINAAIVGTSPQGLLMVGYGKFNTKAEAELSVDEFRKIFVADAWVFEKNKM